MSVYGSLRGFEASLPRMCLYCRAGWLVYSTIMDDRVPSVACAHHDHTARPRTKKGAKLPERDYMPIMSPGDLCERFRPIKITDTKAALLDVMGFFDEVALRPLPPRKESEQ